ncbi:UNVERIFIED_CONTAM: hypothetical protein FKN15_021066, partial [Acipenser sinensis]
KAVKTSGKKSNNPVQFDLGDMLQVLERKQQAQKSKQDPKPVVLSVGGALPMVPKNPLVQKKHPRQLEKVAHNPLDSTSPLVKKGKQREVPKAKKPSPLKKIILKEREERKQYRLLEEQGLNPATEITVSNVQNEEPFEEELEGHQSLNTPDFTDGPSSPDVPDQLEEKQEKTDEPTPIESQAVSNRLKIHSRRFREYCSQVLSKEIDNSVIDLLKELVRFQDRLYLKDPLKAKMKRRLVMGLREVLKHLKLKKVKCVIISPNCERVQSKGGLDEALHTIIDTCREQNVPFVFALARKTLGRCVNKAVPVSAVGIFNYDGAQDHFHKVIELSSEARNAYEEMVASLEKGEGYEDQDEFPQNLPALQDTAQQTSESDEPEYTGQDSPSSAQKERAVSSHEPREDRRPAHRRPASRSSSSSPSPSKKRKRKSHQSHRSESSEQLDKLWEVVSQQGNMLAELLCDSTASPAPSAPLQSQGGVHAEWQQEDLLSIAASEEAVDQEFPSEEGDSDGATPVVHVSLSAELLPLIKRARVVLNVPWPVDDKWKHSVFEDDPVSPSGVSSGTPL